MKKTKWVIGLLVLALILIAAEKRPLEQIREKGAVLVALVEEEIRSLRHSDIPGLEGQAVLVMDRNTGEVIYSEQGKKKMYPASTTKILTAVILLENSRPDASVTVGNEVLRRAADESSAGLVPGETLTVKELAAAMLLPSGNDAARTAAAYVARLKSGKDLEPEEANAVFAELMNERAKAIGAKRSHFVNPHGLHDPNHYTTANDMALIAREAMDNADFRAIVSESQYDATSDERHVRHFENRNKLLDRGGDWYFQGANGIKTGYTEKAGYCFVGSAVQDGKELITVVLNSSEQGVWSDTVKLLEYGFTF
ncbi:MULTISPECIES: D-alanyl-D-alanine carboxypeptidase family protein [Paenibacillus]|uniref:D-alanyl-D-alanine carboxypeptidase family protein n=1 Tax=Paenibacillus TaxID=44249 RepID=UPI002FE15C1A